MKLCIGLARVIGLIANEMLYKLEHTNSVRFCGLEMQVAGFFNQVTEHTR